MRDKKKWKVVIESVVLFLLASFVSQSRKQWKSEISAVVVSDGHECNVLSMFTNSKLFQRLLCLGVGSSELCKLQLGDPALGQATAADEHWFASLNGRNVDGKSTSSSDTEAMEYEDIDRYLVTVDSAAVAKDMMEGRASHNSVSNLADPRHPRGLSFDEQGPLPSPAYHDPEFTFGQKLSLKIKRKYTKRKKSKQNGPFRMKDALEDDVAKIQKTRVVKIIDPGTNCFTGCV